MTDFEFEGLVTEAAGRYAMSEARELLRTAPEIMPSAAYLAWETDFLANQPEAIKRSRPTLWRRMMNTAASIALVAILSLGLVLAVNPEARATAARIWAQVQEAFVKIGFSGQAQEIDDWAPGYLAEGFSETEHRFDGTKGRRTYENNTMDWIIFQYSSTADGRTVYLDYEHSVTHMITINDQPATLMQADSPEEVSYLLWSSQDQDVSFLLSAQCDWKEMIKMAESLAIQGQ